MHEWRSPSRHATCSQISTPNRISPGLQIVIFLFSHHVQASKALAREPSRKPRQGHQLGSNGTDSSTELDGLPIQRSPLDGPIPQGTFE